MMLGSGSNNSSCVQAVVMCRCTISNGIMMVVVMVIQIYIYILGGLLSVSVFDAASNNTTSFCPSRRCMLILFDRLSNWRWVIKGWLTVVQETKKSYNYS